MKSGNCVSDFCFNAWEAMLEAYLALPRTEAADRENLFKSMAQCQLELWGLTSLRLKACLSMPGELAHSKTPLDVVRTQAKFCETAFLQGADCTRRMADAVGAVTGTNGKDAMQGQAFARDLITLPVSRKARRSGEWHYSDKSGDQRRVA
jgi:hypothetical protein